MFSCEFSKNFVTHFKYTSGRLLLEEHWISLKRVPVAIANWFLILVIKGSSYFSLFWDLLTANLGKFLQKLLSKFYF